MMKKQIIVVIFLLFESYGIEADVPELKLNDRSYLPPLENKLDKGYLPPENKNSHRDQSYHEPNEFSKENLSYKHNKPKVIDDPLPMKVDYVQPLGLDFISGQYKPIYKGALISGLFYNENKAKSLNRDISNETPLNEVLTAQEKEQLKTESTTLNSLNVQDTTREKLPARNRQNKNLVEDVVPINYYVDEVTKYKLFNYDDETILSSSEPVVIFKPGDDISFTEDTTIIDNYEHMFPLEFIKKHLKPSAKKEATTTTTTSSSPPTPPAHYTTSDSHSNEATKHQPATSTEKSESKPTTGPGYIYEKPKITFTF